MCTFGRDILSNPDTVRPIVIRDVIDDIRVCDSILGVDREFVLDTADRVPQRCQGSGDVRIKAIVKEEEGLGCLKWLQALVPM